jgi:hypothetical protein
MSVPSLQGNFHCISDFSFLGQPAVGISGRGSIRTKFPVRVTAILRQCSIHRVELTFLILKIFANYDLFK